MAGASLPSDSLRAHAAHASFANIVLALSQWAVLIVLAKFYSKDDLGLFVFTLSVATPVFLLSSLKLRSIVATDVAAETPLNTYLLTRTVTSLTALGISLAIMAAVTPYADWLAVLFILIFKFSDSLTELSHSYFQRLKKFRLISVLKSARAAVLISGLFLATLVSDRLVLLCTAMAVAYTAACVGDLVLALRMDRAQGAQRVARNQWRSIIRHIRSYGHLGLALVGGSLFVYAPTYFIGHFQGIETVGAFGSVTYFLAAGNVFISGLSQAATPQLARIAHAGDGDVFGQITRKLVMAGAILGLAGTIVAMIWGDTLLRLIYNDTVAELHLELVLVAIVALVRYVSAFLGTALTATRVFVPQTVIQLSGVLLVVFACMWLVPRFGTTGAVAAMLSGALAVGVMHLVAVRKEFLRRGWGSGRE